MISGVLFDVDGTLIDSVDVHARCWQSALEKFGFKIPFDLVRSQIGKGGDQLLPVFLGEKDLALRSKGIEAFRSELFHTRDIKTLRGFPGVRELFLQLKARNIKRVLASSAAEDELAQYQALLEIDDLVDAATSKSDVKESKPAADIFAVAMRGLGPPKNLRVIGDSPFDLEAARKIGIPSIAVRSGGFPEEDLRRAGCIAVYDGPEDLLRNIDLWTAWI